MCMCMCVTGFVTSEMHNFDVVKQASQNFLPCDRKKLSISHGLITGGIVTYQVEKWDASIKPLFTNLVTQLHYDILCDIKLYVRICILSRHRSST